MYNSWSLDIEVDNLFIYQRRSTKYIQSYLCSETISCIYIHSSHPQFNSNKTYQLTFVGNRSLGESCRFTQQCAQANTVCLQEKCQCIVGFSEFNSAYCLKGELTFLSCIYIFRALFTNLSWMHTSASHWLFDVSQW